MQSNATEEKKTNKNENEKKTKTSKIQHITNAH